MKIGFKAIKKKAKEGMKIGDLSKMVNLVVKDSLEKMDGKGFKMPYKKPVEENFAENLVEEIKKEKK